MSEGEIFLLMASLITAAIFWGRWLYLLLRLVGSSPRPVGTFWLIALPAVLGLLLLAILQNYASADVRDSSLYTCLYLTFGLAWVVVWLWALAWLGLSAREDVMERGNRPAVAVIFGAGLALMLAFGGANIGDGPGWWVVVFCAFCSTLSLYAAWWLVEWAGRVSELVTIDRDAATAMRFAVWLVACGLILGRAVAGNWVSEQATLHDFGAFAWPVILFVLAEIVNLKIFRPRVDQARVPLLLGGILPSILYFGVAVLYVNALGIW